MAIEAGDATLTAMAVDGAPSDVAATGSAAGFARFATERLMVRAMHTDDVRALAAYRNDPDPRDIRTGRCHSTRMTAARFVDKQMAKVWPVNGDWVQMAVAAAAR